MPDVSIVKVPLQVGKGGVGVTPGSGVAVLVGVPPDGEVSAVGVAPVADVESGTGAKVQFT